MEATEVWHTAAEMIRQFEGDAAITAALRADALLDQGDLQGFNVWKRVVAAINELEKTSPVAGEGMH